MILPLMLNINEQMVRLPKIIILILYVVLTTNIDLRSLFHGFQYQVFYRYRYKDQYLR